MIYLCLKTDLYEYKNFIFSFDQNPITIKYHL